MSLFSKSKNKEKKKEKIKKAPPATVSFEDTEEDDTPAPGYTIADICSLISAISDETPVDSEKPKQEEKEETQEQEAEKEKEPSPLLQALQSLTKESKYGIAVVKAVQDYEREALLTKCEDCPDSQCISLEDNCILLLFKDCRLNKRAFDNLCDTFFNGLLPLETYRYYALSDGKTNPYNLVLLAVSEVLATERKMKLISSGGLTEELVEVLENNIKQQIERQLAMQFEETGQIDVEDLQGAKLAEDMTVEEYNSYLSEQELHAKEEAVSHYVDDDMYLIQILHNMKKRETLDDHLYMVALATTDMNSLVLISSIREFEDLCEEAGLSMIQCSYIYSVSTTGGHWYGSNHPTKEIEELFKALARVCVKQNGQLQKTDIYSLPHISIFKDVYFQ